MCGHIHYRALFPFYSKVMTCYSFLNDSINVLFTPVSTQSTIRFSTKDIL